LLLVAASLGRPAWAAPATEALEFDSGQQQFTAALNGGLQGTVSGSGNFKQWLLFFHADIGISVPMQTRSATLVGAPINVLTSPRVTTDLDFDDELDVTDAVVNPMFFDSLAADLLNSAIIPITLSEVSFDFEILSLITAQLRINAAGGVDVFRFDGTGPGELLQNTTSIFAIPGDFTGGLNATVTGRVTNLPSMSPSKMVASKISIRGEFCIGTSWPMTGTCDRPSLSNATTGKPAMRSTSVMPSPMILANTVYPPFRVFRDGLSTTLIRNWLVALLGLAGSSGTIATMPRVLETLLSLLMAGRRKISWRPSRPPVPVSAYLPA
jgi:hypothetical protein